MFVRPRVDKDIGFVVRLLPASPSMLIIACVTTGIHLVSHQRATVNPNDKCILISGVGMTKSLELSLVEVKC